MPPPLLLVESAPPAPVALVADPCVADPVLVGPPMLVNGVPVLDVIVPLAALCVAPCAVELLVPVSPAVVSVEPDPSVLVLTDCFELDEQPDSPAPSAAHMTSRAVLAARGVSPRRGNEKQSCMAFGAKRGKDTEKKQ